MSFGSKPKVPPPPPPPDPPPPIQRADAMQDLSSGGGVARGGVSGIEPSLIAKALSSKSGAQRKKTLGST